MFLYGGTSLRPIRAVLFDMDGLLIDSERLALECDRLAFRDLGIDMDRSVALRTLGETAESSMRIYENAIGHAFDFDRFTALINTHYSDMLAAGHLHAKPGASELLDLLASRNLPYALASSSGRNRITVSLAACGLSSRFQVMACGDDHVRSKPAPDIFLLAAQRLHIPPADCLVLEDSPSGIRAACSGGMQVCFIPDLIPWRPEWQSFCQHACESLLDVPALLG